MSKGLFEKNLILMSETSIKAHLLVVGIVFLVYIFTKSIFGVVVGLSMYVNSFIMSIIKEDESNNTIRYVSGLPISARKIAGTTFATYYMLVLINLIVCSLFWIIVNLIFGGEVEQSYLQAVVIIITLSSIYSLLIPLSYKFTTQKAFGAFVGIIFAISILIGGIVGFISNLSILICLSLLVAVFIPIISYFLTVKFVKN